MPFTYSFQKILELRKRQKEQKTQEYEQSVQQFERMASSLYELLKQKEQIESLYKEQMSGGTYVHQLQQSEKAMFQLQHQIADIQKQTDKARDNMHRKQQEMQEASIEWKKYSKMKDWEKEAFHQEEKRQEEKMMDEISTRKFAFR
ncbi:flagellar export protein FliJ [Salibacterium halotolerans]|uniref:Flagellar FliJ protein n=1 Tax=Salibacterium halotolerans TaxID=1884432 RepID=A0A1I5MD18_9BACI|nr:flagellar export protein FliJ [Salibacterium halotolerans]SFP07494.1 flagellar FliJ protein [Salibacterium halotolerans]